MDLVKSQKPVFFILPSELRFLVTEGTDEIKAG
jgi:hypothetical protein